MCRDRGRAENLAQQEWVLVVKDVIVWLLDTHEQACQFSDQEASF